MVLIIYIQSNFQYSMILEVTYTKMTSFARFRRLAPPLQKDTCYLKVSHSAIECSDTLVARVL